MMAELFGVYRRLHKGIMRCCCNGLCRCDNGGRDSREMLTFTNGLKVWLNYSKYTGESINGSCSTNVPATPAPCPVAGCVNAAGAEMAGRNRHE